MNERSELALVVESLSQQFQGRMALQEVSFTVDSGSIHGFVGPNGAGKTTTLKVMATLLRASGGTVKVFGQDVRRDRREVRRLLGFLPDQNGLYRRMTVQEYLEFFAAAYGMAAQERGKVVDEVLQLTDMGGRRHDLIQGLSRGMEQRLGLARVLVHDPRLLLLDEPASGLDPRARIELMEILRALSGMGKTIFISSHILSELASLCDAVTVIDRGQVRYTGSMEQLLTHETEEEVGYEMVLEEEHPAFLAALEADPQILRVSFEAEQLRLALVAVKGAVTSTHLLQRALEMGVRMRSFDRSRRHLDRAFLDLTQPGVGP